MVLLACNQAFDLRSTRLQDAAPDVNCATVTPDEDADCVADSVDNCPGLANTAQLDLDHDGVGDECDPRQGRDGDEIVQFDNFNDPAAAQQHWRDVEPNRPTQFVFEQGYVRHTSITDGFSTLQSTTPIEHAEVTVEVGFDLVDLDLSMYPHVAVLSDAQLDDTNGNHCQLDTDDPANAMQMRLLMREWNALLADPNTGGATTITHVYPPTTRPVPLVLTFRRSDTDGELECELRYGFRRGSAGTIVRSPTLDVWPSTRYVSVFLKNAAIDIKWITVYAVR